MYTRLVIILVLMVILLTISSYIPPQTSSSLPTKRVDNVDIKSLDDLRTKKLKVGYRQGAFVKPFLTTKVGVSESQLVELRTEVDILDKFQKGGEEGGVDALVAGTHHLVLLKEKYCENFTIVQDVTFKSSGLGFAFRTDHSTLRNKFSEAIVTLIDNGRMAEIQYATIGTLKDKECVEKPVAGGSTFQDSILMWLPAASAAFVVVLVIVMLLSYCASLCFKK